MLYREIITVCSEIHTKHTNCMDKMQGFLDAEVRSMYSYPNYICTGVPDITGLLCSHSGEEEAWREPPPPPPASQSQS